MTIVTITTTMTTTKEELNQMNDFTVEQAAEFDVFIIKTLSSLQKQITKQDKLIEKLEGRIRILESWDEADRFVVRLANGKLALNMPYPEEDKVQASESV